MADIFISYARRNVEIAKRLAKALERRGWSVFWDPYIPTGKRFPDVIEIELISARCVVALWSEAANASNWVREEADAALERNILVPALIETTRPPIGFRSVHAADLIDWRGDEAHPGFLRLIKDITSLVGAPSRRASSTVRPESADKIDISKPKPNTDSKQGGGEAVGAPSRTRGRPNEHGNAVRKPVSVGAKKALATDAKSPVTNKSDNKTAIGSRRRGFRSWIVLPVMGLVTAAMIVFGWTGTSKRDDKPRVMTAGDARVDMVNIKVWGDGSDKPWRVLVNKKDKGFTQQSVPLVLSVGAGTTPEIECRRKTVVYRPPVASVEGEINIHCNPPE